MVLNIKILKNISWWLSGLYVFWLGFLIALCLNSQNQLLIPLIIFFVVVTVASGVLLFFLLKKIKMLKNLNLKNWKKIFLVVVFPFSFYWLINNWQKSYDNESKQ